MKEKKHTSKVRYIKLPYSAKFSEQLCNKLQKLYIQYFKERNFKIVFTSLQIGSFL